MAEYFWAGLLLGLLIWVLAEAAMQFRRPVCKRLRERVFAVVQADGPVGEMEYCLRRIRADLAGCGFNGCEVLLLDENLGPEERDAAARLEGVRLCTGEELKKLPLDL